MKWCKGEKGSGERVNESIQIKNASIQDVGCCCRHFINFFLFVLLNTLSKWKKSKQKDLLWNEAEDNEKNTQQQTRFSELF